MLERVERTVTKFIRGLTKEHFPAKTDWECLGLLSLEKKRFCGGSMLFKARLDKAFQHPISWELSFPRIAGVVTR